jgi:hypothetical protein
MRVFFACAAVCALAVFAAGCVSVSYDGKLSYPETVSPEIFTDKSQIIRKYTVMGKAAAHANADRYTKQDLEDSLREKAAKEGADAVLIFRYAVVPDYECREDQLMNYNHSGVWTADDASKDGWKNFENKFDYYYDYKENRAKTKGNPIYERVIKALFLKYDQPDGSPSAAPAQKAGAAPPAKTADKPAEPAAVKADVTSAPKTETAPEEKSAVKPAAPPETAPVTKPDAPTPAKAAESK